jgi:hypothetical protein
MKSSASIHRVSVNRSANADPQLQEAVRRKCCGPVAFDVNTRLNSMHENGAPSRITAKHNAS